MASSIYKNLEFQASNVKNRILAFKLPSWNGITNWASSASHQPLFVASDFRRIVCSIRACSIQCTIRFGVRSRGWIFRERIESRRLGRLSYKNSFERLPSCGIRRWDWLCFWIHIWFQNCVENPFMPQIPSFIEDSTFGQARLINKWGSFKLSQKAAVSSPVCEAVLFYYVWSPGYGSFWWLPNKHRNGDIGFRIPFFPSSSSVPRFPRIPVRGRT